MTSPKSNSWGKAQFTIQNGSDKPRAITLSGRQRWALECLRKAGKVGCTPFCTPGPRWSGYVYSLKKHGLIIETVTETHSGPFSGTHARYVLRSKVTRAQSEVAA